MQNEFIKRSYEFEVRASEDEENGKYITGRAVVYESKTDLGYFDEIISRGALDKADISDVRFLINHNTDMVPLARSRKDEKNSTMQINVDNEGMEIRVKLDTENNSDARNLYSAIQRGDITGMSFMFSIENEEWENLDSDHPTRHIHKIGMVAEVSAVTFPAYEKTEINARCKKTVDIARSLKRARITNVDDTELEKLKAKYLYNI